MYFDKFLQCFRYLVSCSLLCCFIFVSAQEQTNKQEYRSLLWEISGDDLKNPSYLYGTMHSKDALVHQLGDSVMVKLAACDAVAVEVVMESTDMLSMIFNMYMRDTTLQDLYSADEYKRVKSHVSEHLGLMGVLFDLDKCKPIFLSSLVSDNKSQEEADLPLDMFLQEKGRELGKLVLGLETVAEQMAALDKVPLHKQAGMLLEQIEKVNTHDSTMQQMLDLYVSQNLDGLYHFYESDIQNVPSEFNNAVLVERNFTMLHRADSLIHLRPTFIAVGALHLPGPTGLIELLRKKGYKVSPVYSTYNKKGAERRRILERIEQQEAEKEE